MTSRSRRACPAGSSSSPRRPEEPDDLDRRVLRQRRAHRGLVDSVVERDERLIGGRPTLVCPLKTLRELVRRRCRPASPSPAAAARTRSCRCRRRTRTAPRPSSEREGCSSARSARSFRGGLVRRGEDEDVLHQQTHAAVHLDVDVDVVAGLRLRDDAVRRVEGRSRSRATCRSSCRCRADRPSRRARCSSR